VKVRIALAALAGVATLATVGVVATAASAGASTIPTTVSHVNYPPPGAGWQLSATLTRGPQTAWNYRELILTLTNTSHLALTVAGYPGLQLLNNRYWPLPTTTVRVSERTWGQAAITLFPGQSATAEITFTVYGHVFPFYSGPPMLSPSAAYLAVTLPSGAHFVLKIPGGPVRIAQDRLTETALTGHFPFPSTR
jgi:Protein of unknown function (DUF4232)